MHGRRKRDESSATKSLTSDAALFRLLTWLSPSFPVGAFAYSSGIEWAVEQGDINDAHSLRDWVRSLLSGGMALSDAIFLCHAYLAVQTRDKALFRSTAELAWAFAPSKERQLETTAQGRAFMDVARKAWGCEALDWVVAALEPNRMTYPVAVASLGAGHGVKLSALLHGFLHAQVSNWISAGVRLIPLGQTESQKVLVQLESDISRTASCAMMSSLDDVGSNTFRADLASMRHETQYTRLFRS